MVVLDGRASVCIAASSFLLPARIFSLGAYLGPNLSLMALVTARIFGGYGGLPPFLLAFHGSPILSAAALALAAYATTSLILSGLLDSLILFELALRTGFLPAFAPALRTGFLPAFAPALRFVLALDVRVLVEPVRPSLAQTMLPLAVSLHCIGVLFIEIGG